jgi:hypothetical protein
MTSKATSPGPQVGAPPSLEQVPLDRLQVDPAYQRAIDGSASRRIIDGMVKRWDWALAQPLMVARRADGSLWILDGQHRHAGAAARGDIAFLPCVILSSLDHAGEARTFVDLNTRRQRLSQGQVFHGMLAAGDSLAVKVQALLDETGWNVRRISNTASFNPGDLECAPMLTRALDQRGEPAVWFALIALRTAYTDRPVRVAATLLKALFELFDKVGSDGVSFEAITRTMGASLPHEWVNRGIRLQEKNLNWDKSTAIASAIMEAALGKPTPAAPAPSTGHPAIAARIATPLSLHAAPTAKSPFGAEGKGWCDQCQSLRSRQHASTCGSQFCSLRPHA